MGGAILGSPRKALTGVFLPELGSYLARLAIIAVFLGAYSIPVTFHNVASVTASNSISNTRLADARRRRSHPGDEQRRALEGDERRARRRPTRPPSS